MEAMPTVSSSVEKLPQIPHISLTQRHQTIRHPEKCSKPENDAICGLGILALGLQERLESLEGMIEELGQQVSLDTMRRRFCPPNNIVEMKLEVNLSSYDELLSADRIDPTGQEG